MRRPLLSSSLLVVALIATANPFAVVAQDADALAWPPVTAETRPWTRWWWMGSAVNAEDLSRELARYHEAGLGGVEITPIYGVKGSEKDFIEYLSPRWMEMMQHSVRVAASLGMGVNMANGSGWCFGGPNVSPEDANASVVWKKVEVAADGKVGGDFDRKKTQALMAYPAGGESAVDLTGRIGADGIVNWAAPANGAPWTVYAISQKPSGVVVKRPAPGGAGPMLNLFYPGAMTRYLKRFDDAFEKVGKGAPQPSGMFHDSYEYRSDWAPDFFAQFEKRRGYKLQQHLPALFGGEKNDEVARVKSDYRETISDLQAEESIPEWVRWSHQHGFTTREQAHGSPGNWLDIYAAADVPETEMFDTDRDVLVSKFASSAAHVAGKKLVGSETGTWVAEHFTETLADLKGIVDELFLSGVNRVTFHGTAYSPDSAAWPGWCFYASSELNPRNAIWRDLPALTAYITRVQSVLQAGRSDNDVLLYWPIHDVWHNPDGMVQQFTIHKREWFYNQRIGKTAAWLYNHGTLFDYVSDRLLAKATADPASGIVMDGGVYRAVIVPQCGHLPAATMAKLLDLAKGGATVMFEEALPSDVPGFANLEQRRSELKRISEQLRWENDANIRKATLGKGQVLTGPLDSLVAYDVPPAPISAAANAADEKVSDLRVLRRDVDGDKFYFVFNHGERRFDSEIEMTGQVATSAVLMDPMTGKTGIIRLGKSEASQSGAKFRLQLDPRQTLILRTLKQGKESVASWNLQQGSGAPIELKGTWKIEFLQGGPELPPSFKAEKLDSWTVGGGAKAEVFAGTARYTLRFDTPEALGQSALLDLGEVCQSARVRLNGKDLGTTFIKPFRMVAEGLRARDNLLEIEVTGTSANRVRDLDARKVKWKIFYDTNIVSRDYKPFDASRWDVARQGLLGPVTIQAAGPTN